MIFPIKSEDYHHNEIKRLKKSNEHRSSLDVSNAGLSSWATMALVARHERAISALCAGKNGKPAALISGLWLGDRLVSNERTWDRYGKQQWILSTEQRAEFNRYAIPCGNRSRVQRSLGMVEETRSVPVRPHFKVVSNGVGCPESYRFEAMELAA